MRKLVYYEGESCPVCKVLRPKVEELCSIKGFAFYGKDADENMEDVVKLGLRSLPAMALYDENWDLEMKGSGWDFFDILKNL